MQLSADSIIDWIKKHPKASICNPEGVHMFKDIANFQDYHGLPEFRQVLLNWNAETMVSLTHEAYPWIHIIDDSMPVIFFSRLLRSLWGELEEEGWHLIQIA